jgi:GTP-binding protein
MFSALKKQGVDDVARLLWQWAHPVRAEGTPAAADGAPDAASTDTASDHEESQQK